MNTRPKSDSAKCTSYDPIKGLCKILGTKCDIVKADPKYALDKSVASKSDRESMYNCNRLEMDW